MKIAGSCIVVGVRLIGVNAYLLTICRSLVLVAAGSRPMLRSLDALAARGEERTGNHRPVQSLMSAERTISSAR